MRIYILTQEDAFYIPVMLDHLLAARRDDIVGIGIVPGELRGRHLGRYLEMMGPWEFALQSLNLLAHKLLDGVSRLVRLRRSYSVAGAARRWAMPLETVPQVNADSFVKSLEDRRIDLLVSIACPQILKKRTLEMPGKGCINIHGALLPRYQGLLPSFWVLAKGEPETGVTVHWVDEKIDHGAIILQERVRIRDDDTVHSLVRRSKIEVGKQLLVEAIRRIESGELEPCAANQEGASYFSYPDREAIREFRARGRRFI
jgi:methionyl-tRNA formyltransferase